MHLRPYITKTSITILEKYQILTLASDIMFVNGLRFIFTKSRATTFTRTQFITSKKEKDLYQSILEVKKLYQRRGFDINSILMDKIFECFCTHLSAAQKSLNVCLADKHVHEIEQMILVVKERSQRVYNTLSFKKMPGRMIIELIYTSVFWLKSRYLIPCTIMTGHTVDFNTCT